MKRIICVTLCALCVFAVTVVSPHSAARGNVLHGLGAIGAGASADGPTHYAAILQTHRGLNFGGPGVPYAYGSIGSDSASVLLPGNQVDQLVAEAQAGNITLANIFNGNNDYIDVANEIIDGTLAGAALAAHQAQVQANLEAAVGAIQGAGASVVLGGLSNFVHAPAAAAVKADPVARARLENAMLDGKNLLADFALSQGIPFVDFFELMSAVYDAGSVQVGGVDLILTGFDNSDQHYFWQSSFQANTIVNGVIANLFLQAINEGYGTNVPLLSDEEILTIAGLEGEYVGETFALAHPYSNFVSIPEPVSVIPAAIGLAAFATLGVLRRTRRSFRWKTLQTASVGS